MGGYLINLRHMNLIKIIFFKAFGRGFTDKTVKQILEIRKDLDKETK